MILIDEGKVGSGKTLSAVATDLVRYLALGRIVITNIELNRDAVVEECLVHYGVEIDFENQVLFLTDDEKVNYKKRNGVIVKVSKVSLFFRYLPAGLPGKPNLAVIDEAPLWLDSRNWGETPEELLDFIRQSRKQHTDVIFITQDHGDLDKKIRVHAQYIRHHRCLRTMGVKLGIFNVRVPIPVTARYWHDYNGEYFKTQFLWRRSRFFQLYNTYSVLKDFERLPAKSISLSDVKEVIPMKAVLILSIALLGVCCWNLGLSRRIASLESAGSSVAVPAAPSSSSKPLVDKPSAPVAVIYDGQREIGLAYDDDGRQMRLVRKN